MRVILYKMILIVSSALLCIFFIEILLRLFSPIHLADYIWVYQYDEELGIRVKENLNFTNTTDYQQEMSTNRWGTINFHDSFAQYRELIFTIGDSFTQGTGLPSDANYPFQLDLMLNIRKGVYTPLYAVVNLGLAAYGMEQAILSLKRYVSLLGAPQYILYLGSPNDYRDDLLFKQGYRHKQFVDENPMWGLALKPIQWSVYKTEIGKRVILAIKTLIKKRQDSKQTNIKRQESRSAVVSARLQRQFERLDVISKELGAKLIVSWAELPSDRSRSYEWLKQWSSTQKIAFADWYPLSNSVLSNIPALPVNNNHSGGHHRIWINLIIAKAFSKHINIKK